MDYAPPPPRRKLLINGMIVLFTLGILAVLFISRRTLDRSALSLTGRAEESFTAPFGEELTVESPLTDPSCTGEFIPIASNSDEYGDYACIEESQECFNKVRLICSDGRDSGVIDMKECKNWGKRFDDPNNRRFAGTNYCCNYKTDQNGCFVNSVSDEDWCRLMGGVSGQLCQIQSSGKKCCLITPTPTKPEPPTPEAPPATPTPAACGQACDPYSSSPACAPGMTCHKVVETGTGGIYHCIPNCSTFPNCSCPAGGGGINMSNPSPTPDFAMR